MSLVMMKTSQLSTLAFLLYKTHRPAGRLPVASPVQQNGQHDAYLWNPDCRRVFFPPLCFLNQEPCGYKRKRLMMIPTSPNTYFIIRQARFGFSTFDTILQLI